MGKFSALDGNTFSLEINCKPNKNNYLIAYWGYKIPIFKRENISHNFFSTSLMDGRTGFWGNSKSFYVTILSLVMSLLGESAIVIIISGVTIFSCVFGK